MAIICFVFGAAGCIVDRCKVCMFSAWFGGISDPHPAILHVTSCHEDGDKNPGKICNQMC